MIVTMLEDIPDDRTPWMVDVLNGTAILTTTTNCYNYETNASSARSRWSPR